MYKYIKRTTKKHLAIVRKEMLHEMGISVDYYPASETPKNHCAWVCTDIDCDKCGDGFNTYPKFINHLRVHHNINFCEVKEELWMRQSFHDIEI